ncbi:hypothetical protein, partial [Desulfovibrio piger]|uniref:hypothetical protein n=1 Tax=Desulfovibrio piger TaxID=901 RepID=UPI001E187552
MLLVSLVCVTFLLACAGKAVACCWGISLENPFLSIWLGFLAVTLIGMGASLFVPLSSPFAYVPVFMLMVGGMQKTLLDLKIFFYRMFFDKKRSDIILVLCILGFSLPAALGLTRNTVGYDSDLYISQAVRWLVE